jgi:SdpI/YhfL family protein
MIGSQQMAELAAAIEKTRTFESKKDEPLKSRKVDKKLILVIIILFLGALEVVLSFPFLLEKVPPNQLYGFRTDETLSNPEIWYKANKDFANDLTAIGIATVMISFVVFFFRSKMPGYAVLIALILTAHLPLVLVIIKIVSQGSG